jgi:RNA polymerase sigma-70 factor (ECF subfamily)
MHCDSRPLIIFGEVEMTEDHPGLGLVDATSVSLLDRLKAARPEAVDWQHLQSIYLPLIRRWLRRVPGLGDEADDLAQEVFLVVIRELPRFERRREGSFRAWLRMIAVNKARSYCKQRDRRPAVGLDLTDGFLEKMADPDSDLAREWDREHDEHVVRKILAAVQPDFSPATWEAFRRFALEGLPAARVAEELGLTENAVLLAKSRVIRRLREEAGDLLR